MDVITCAIFGDCRLRGVGVVRWVILPYPIDLSCRPYNTGQLPRDHVIPLHTMCTMACSGALFSPRQSRSPMLTLICRQGG